MQNKCIPFCLQFDKMSTSSHKEFKDLNWSPVSSRFEQCVISTVFKFINGNCLYYLNEVFEFVPEANISLRNNFFKLKRPFRNTNNSQKALSFIGTSFWNRIPETLKKANNLNTFKHNLKKHFFNQMTWFLLTLSLLLILFIVIIIIITGNIIIIITVITIVIVYY